MALVASIAGGAIEVAAACVLAESPALAADKEPAAAFVWEPSAPMGAVANAQLGRLLDGRSELVIAGEQLNFEPLRRFYARHGFGPVWMNHPAQANLLTNAVLHAGEHGLAPQLFHANLLLSPTLPPLSRELLLSDAVLSYAAALARGVMPVEGRRDDEALTPEPIDVTAALDAAIARPDPVAAIEALAPTTLTYRLLRQALQNFHTGIPVDSKTSADRLRQIEVNLERERWLPRGLPADRVWVNIADERLVLYRDDRSIFSTRIIVGQDERRNQSPEFQANINGVFFNPPWNIPQDIANNEILPKTSHDPNYLTRHNMVLLPNGVLQQRPGPNSGLGQMVFDMKNRFDVYLHDTPSKNLFSREDRRVSHGCIRVEKAHDLAALLMQSVEAVDEAIATGGTIHRDLPKPVPVFVVYETAFADADGRLQFRPDVYGRDGEIWVKVDPERRPVAETGPRSQRRG